MGKKKVFIYHGKDNYPVQRRINLLREEQSKQQKHFQLLQFNTFDYLEGGGFNDQKGEELVRTVEVQIVQPSFGVQGVIAVIWNYEKLMRPRTIPLLSRIMENLGDHFLFLVSADLQFKKDIVDKNFIKKFSFVQYERSLYPVNNILRARLEEYATTHQRKFNRECIQFLVQYFNEKARSITEAQTDLMKKELEKIELYFPRNRVIASAEVSEILDELRDFRMYYDITDAFFKRNIPLTLKNFLLFLREQEDLNQLISNFIFQITDLLHFKEELQQKKILRPPEYYGVAKRRFEENQKRNALFHHEEVIHILNDFLKMAKLLKSEVLKNPNVTKGKVALNVKNIFEKTVVLRLADRENFYYRKEADLVNNR